MNILYPTFAMLFLTIAVMMRLGYARYRAVVRREVDHHYYKLYRGEEPDHLRVLSRHLSNLLEVPPLFYVACLIALVTKQQGILVLSLAWAFVALRFAHTVIHLSGNMVALRFRVFVLSMVVLTAMLLTLFIGIL
jgi:hypothetical protein